MRGPQVLGRNSGEKNSVPIFLLTMFYLFTYRYIIRYQIKNTKTRKKILGLETKILVLCTREIVQGGKTMYKKVYKGLDYDIVCIFDKVTGKLVKSYVEVHE